MEPETGRSSFLFLALCLSLFVFTPPAAAERSAPCGADPAKAVVQLVAVGPGAAEKNLNCSSTGFFINEEGYLLTNAHAVEEARQCLAGTRDASILARFAAPASSAAAAVSCNVVAVDEAHDLALLKAARRHPRGIPYPFLPLEPREPDANARLTVTGHPDAAWNAVTLRGRVVRSMRMRLGPSGGEASEVFVLGFRLERGASGSPVFDARGAVVGIVTRRNPSNPHQTVAVAIRHALRLLQREGVAWSAPNENPINE